MEDKENDFIITVITSVYCNNESEVYSIRTFDYNWINNIHIRSILILNMKTDGTAWSFLFFFFFANFPFSIVEDKMEENIDKAVKNGEKSAVLAILLWVCALIGAFVLKCFMQFIKWVFQK